VYLSQEIHILLAMEELHLISLVVFIFFTPLINTSNTALIFKECYNKIGGCFSIEKKCCVTLWKLQKLIQNISFTEKQTPGFRCQIPKKVRKIGMVLVNRWSLGKLKRGPMVERRSHAQGKDIKLAQLGNVRICGLRRGPSERHPSLAHCLPLSFSPYHFHVVSWA
jgi:hypothetical protein